MAHTSLALPQQVPDTSFPCAEPREACGKKLFVQRPVLAVGQRIDSTELLSLGFPVCNWSLFLGSCWEPCLWLSQHLCLAASLSQAQKWHCFLSKVQMLPALLCWSSVWGGRHSWLHEVTASSGFLWLQQWFKFSSAHPCTWSCWNQVPKLIFAIDPEASAQSVVISTVTPVVNLAKWRHFCHRMKRFGSHHGVYVVQRMKLCCVPVLLQYGWEQGPSSMKGLEGFPFLVEIWWICDFLPLTSNSGGSRCFCVCAVWLQFAFSKKKFSDRVRLAFHHVCLASGTAGPFAKKKRVCCTEFHFSWKISMKTAGKPFPAILGKFAASFFFSL